MSDFQVSSSGELQAALSKAVGGDRIMVNPGVYGTVSISNRNYNSNVTILGTKPDAFVGFDGVKVTGSSNITFENLALGRSLGDGEPDHTYFSTISNAESISLKGVRIHGSYDNDPTNDGNGLLVRDVRGFSISESSFIENKVGLTVLSSSAVVVQGNRFELMRSDGINFIGNNGLVVDRNILTNFKPIATDHSDAIQFFNNGVDTGSRDITLTNNVVLQGDGVGPQGIFMGNPGPGGYHNVLVENNFIFSNDQFNGITLAGVTNGAIIGNTLLSTTSDAKRLWVRLDSTNSVSVINNIFEDIVFVGGHSKLYVDNNLNLKLSPNIRPKMADEIALASPEDLVVPEIGFQLSDEVTLAPIGKAIGKSLLSMSRETRSSSSHEPMIPDTEGEVNSSLLLPSFPLGGGPLDSLQHFALG